MEEAREMTRECMCVSESEKMVGPIKMEWVKGQNLL